MDLGAGTSGTSGNLVQGNYIGTYVTGTVDMGNAFDGVVLKCNVISGNGRYGILITSSIDNLIYGNYIGTAADGITALGNDLEGISSQTVV